MSLIVVGLNHRTVPFTLLERVTIPGEHLAKALRDLASREHLAEVAVLSTCNRTEVYARCTRFHPAVEDIREFLAAHAQADPDDLGEHLYSYYDDAAVAHLLGVASGIDSMIVGEHEILGQVRSAWQAAEAEGTAGQLVSRAFRHSVEAGKRARSETDIGRHAVSIASAAVALATEHVGSLAGRRVLVLGAGEVGEGFLEALTGADARVVVANRTRARAEAIAARIGAEVTGLDGLHHELVAADVLLASTGASDVLVERAEIEQVMAERDGRPLLVVDVALPRDIDPAVTDLDGVTLLHLDALRDFADRSLDLRRREIAKVRRILTEELDRYRIERRAREVAPVITALRSRGEEIRQAELERLRARLAGLDPAQRRAVEALTTGIVNKLLHEPTVRIKAAAGTALGELYHDALAHLFDLASPDDE